MHASQTADPTKYGVFWKHWHEFELICGNEDTFREFLRVKRTVQAKFGGTVNVSMHLGAAAYQQRHGAGDSRQSKRDALAEAIGEAGISGLVVGRDKDDIDLMALVEAEAEAAGLDAAANARAAALARDDGGDDDGDAKSAAATGANDAGDDAMDGGGGGGGGGGGVPTVAAAPLGARARLLQMQRGAAAGGGDDE